MQMQEMQACTQPVPLHTRWTVLSDQFSNVFLSLCGYIHHSSMMDSGERHLAGLTGHTQ